MQKSNNLSRLIQSFGLLGALDVVLFIVLLGANVFFTLQHIALLDRFRPLLPHLNMELFATISTLITTIFAFLINYNILKVIFKLTLDIFSPQKLGFIYLMTSLTSVVGANVIVSVFAIENALANGIHPMLVNGSYGVFILLLTNLYIFPERKNTQKFKSAFLRLNIYLILYVLINVLLSVRGVPFDV